MSLEVRLLGIPVIAADGGFRAVRGQKTWAVLAYLLLTERPPTRRRLASLLFAEASDPLAALRWSLSELRRALGGDVVLSGDPVRLILPDTALVDVLELQAGRYPDRGDDVPGELLESAYFNTCPGFEAWLLVARRRLSGLVEAVLVDRVHRSLDEGNHGPAIDHAGRLVELNPLDERHQALLVRSLAANGDQTGANRQLSAAASLLRRELGVEPSSSLRQAAATTTTRHPSVPGETVRAMIDAGRAASAAGATDAALYCLGSAVTGAETSTSPALLAHALIAYGAALQRLGTSVSDAEPALRRGLALAQEIDDQASTIIALRELGFLHIQAGYHLEGDNHLATAGQLARHDDSQLASIRAIEGMSLCDQARYPDALAALQEAVTRARRCNRHRKEAWALAMLGRVHLLRGEIGPATEALDQAERIARLDRWSAFLAWPEILAAQVDLIKHQITEARVRLNHAQALTQHFNDHGLQALVQRGHALAAAQTNDAATAVRLIDSARAQAFHGSRTYVWVQDQVAATRSELLAAIDPPAALEATNEWIELASKAGLRESVVRAHLAAGRLGQPGARLAALALAAEIDNPYLAAATDATQNESSVVTRQLTRSAPHDDGKQEAHHGRS